MLFNETRNFDFLPDVNVGGFKLETVEEMKLLGLVVRSDLKWTSNTEAITSKGYKKLWMLRRLKTLGANQEDLLNVYTKQIRPTLEFAAPVWHPALTSKEDEDIKRIQKTVAKLIFQEKYRGYQNALESLKLCSLDMRRAILCTNFALKAEKSEKFSHLIHAKNKITITQHRPDKYHTVWARKVKLDKSPISFLTKILNNYYSQK